MPAAPSMRRDFIEILISLVVAGALFAIFLFGADSLNPTELRRETTPIEALQDLLLAAGVLFSLWMFISPEARNRNYVKLWMLILAGVFVLVLGNEISWGRRLFSWHVVNDAWPHGWTHRVSLHPLSPGKIDKPRSATLVIIGLGAVGYPIVEAIRGHRWLGLPAWFGPRLGGIVWPAVAAYTIVANRFLAHGPTIFGITRFQFSQIEELFIYIFLLNYALARRDALRQSPRPIWAQDPPPKVG